MESVVTLPEESTTRYLASAFGSLYFCHFLSTIPLEVEVMWPTKWTWMKAMYMLATIRSLIQNRYSGLGYSIITILLAFSDIVDERVLGPNTITELFVDRNGIMQSVFMIYNGVMVVTIIEVILQMRLHAFFEYRRGIIALVSIAFAAELGGTLYLILSNTSGGMSNALGFTFLPTLVFDVFMLSLFLYKTVQHSKTRHGMGIPAYWGYGGRLVFILTRDTLWYYLCVIVTMAIGVGLNLSYIESGLTEPYTWMVIIPAILTDNMILNLRYAGMRGLTDSESVAVATDFHYS
ncbi:hypothetical protein GLOTRDRAFT_121927 [Gloeophyllum trabeum ATCC 11539]|uniref:Chitin synthase export chaperone n=1 Tax=Gloeophyllum trabeum (strain ATCC 11539 / FP-39264 / Madison 617) TaxID=670483 RepID=S7Q3C1_GLOTA|nr:uncharacterized protein GLOTRDRAFT_121927 [Gloeophyllum trabeum ATCC 11539]EPQ54032.1 hypothetical protein GLOTRDRAFT_121927 [Gloeophyllum trabeum ATCC 11539]